VTIEFLHPTGYGLSSCPSCGRFIDGLCSVCLPPTAERPALSAEEESAAAFQRERELLRRRQNE